MNDEPRRRRRTDDGENEGNGWLSMIALIVVVVLVGLLLGAVLARVFGAKTTVVVSPSPLPTVVVTAQASITPLPPASLSPIPHATPRATPHATSSPVKTAASPAVSPSVAASAMPRPHRSPSAKPSPNAAAIPTPTATPKPRPTKTSSPAPKPLPKPVRAISPARPGPQTAGDRAAAVVRLYLDALARGNTAEARSYLSSGEPSESSFMDRSARLTSLNTTQNADGTYKVDTDLTTANGEYYITFTVNVAPGGAVITDHVAIKP
ncbi:MAG TPA: hypothetical protein VMS32_03670 [Verrucomicrobiae bacterium]|jgi:hypothetical protein|nr:hypothetical protein [Verrucomicrobiae bacterium]